MHRLYREGATRAELQTAQQALYDAYYTRVCNARGFTPGVHAVDTFRGRPLPLARAVTTAVGALRVVAGVQLLECSSDDVGGTPEADALLVTRDQLTASVRAALDTEDGGDTQIATRMR